MNHFGVPSALVPLHSLARLELASTDQAGLLVRGQLGRLSSLTFPLALSSTALLPCKTLLLLLGIVGLAATLLELKEGQVTIPIKQL